MSVGASVFEVLGLDAVLDNGKRLAILTALESPYAQEEGLTYTEVIGLTGVTYGNLPPHARILEDAGYLASRRETRTGAKKRTSYRITPEGRRALEAHHDALMRPRRPSSVFACATSSLQWALTLPSTGTGASLWERCCRE